MPLGEDYAGGPFWCLWGLRMLRAVVVGVVPGDPVASGDRLRAAVAGISCQSSDRWLVKVLPGLYDLGPDDPLVMKTCVDIEGSGEVATIVRGQGTDATDPSATVLGAFNAEIRTLTVEHGTVTLLDSSAAHRSNLTGAGSVTSARIDNGTMNLAVSQLSGMIQRNQNSTLRCVGNYTFDFAPFTCPAAPPSPAGPRPRRN